MCVENKELTVSCFSRCNLSQISVVIAFHFKVKYLTFWITSFWNQIFVQKTLNASENTEIEFEEKTKFKVKT